MKRKLTFYLSFHYTEKNSGEHPKNPNAYVRAHPDVTFWAVGYHPPPPGVPSSFLHILCII